MNIQNCLQHIRGHISGWVTIACCLVFVAGCDATLKGYAGASKSQGEVAIITTQRSNSFGGGLYIRQLDGKYVYVRPAGTIYGSLVSHPRVAVNPGEHVLKLVYSGGYGSYDMRLRVKVEAGHRYIAKYAEDASSVRIWVEDAATGEVVSGPPGDAD